MKTEQEILWDSSACLERVRVRAFEKQNVPLPSPDF